MAFWNAAHGPPLGKSRVICRKQLKHVVTSHSMQAVAQMTRLLWNERRKMRQAHGQRRRTCLDKPIWENLAKGLPRSKTFHIAGRGNEFWFEQRGWNGGCGPYSQLWNVQVLIFERVPCRAVYRRLAPRFLAVLSIRWKSWKCETV